MAIRIRESPDSRDLHYGASGGGVTLKFTAITNDGESESDVWLFALANTSSTLDGFIRSDVKVSPQSGPLFTVTVDYGTTGVGGGDQPLGKEDNSGNPPDNPQAPDNSTTPLTSGWSFSINAPRIHFTQSRRTVASAGRNGSTPPDFERAIGVDSDNKVAGCDWPPDAAFTFTRTVAAPRVTMGYLEILENLAGRVNDAPFYGRAADEVLLMSAQGSYTSGEGWSVTFTFGVSSNETNVEVSPNLPFGGDTLPKKGWQYLWVLHKEINAGGKIVAVADAAYVEEIVRPAPFGLLNIGE